MDSFFFNITDTSYKVTTLSENKSESIKRVDISNGIVFLDIELSNGGIKEFHHKNLDRMLLITVTQKGTLQLHDKLNTTIHKVKENSINIFASSRQDFLFTLDEPSKVFVLCIADFILKRYLSSNENEVINFLYSKLQTELSSELIDSKPIDALSLYIINKITQRDDEDFMNSIKCEHNILEFMIHRFKLIDMLDDELSDDELCISRSAKDVLLRSYITPPSIETLAHLCATNESKLKKVFKKVYKITIYTYIQKLRLEKANLLLREQYLNIGEVAKDVGYKHQGHFSKLFFEHFGVYPKDLLKK